MLMAPALPTETDGPDPASAARPTTDRAGLAFPERMSMMSTGFLTGLVLADLGVAGLDAAMGNAVICGR